MEISSDFQGINEVTSGGRGVKKWKIWVKLLMDNPNIRFIRVSRQETVD